MSPANKLQSPQKRHANALRGVLIQNGMPVRRRKRRRKRKVQDEKKYSSLRMLVLTLLSIPMLRASVLQRRRDPNAYAQIDAYNLIDIVSILLLGYLVFAYAQKYRRSLQTTPIKAYIGYYLFGVLSLLWAVRVEIFYAPFRAYEMIVTMCGCLLFCSLQPNARACYKAIMNFCAVMWIPKVIQIFMIFRSFNLFFYHTNTYTIIGMLSFLLAVGAYVEKVYPWRAIWFPLVSGFVCMCIGTSSATFLAAIIGIVLVGAYHRNNINVARVALFCGVIYLIWNEWSDAVLQFIFPNKSMKLILSGTGRIDMWNYYIAAWLKSPLLGYGFPVGEKEAQLFGWVQTSSSHNAFLSVLINTGLIGMVFFVIFLIATLKMLYGAHTRQNFYVRGLFAAIIAGILNSCSLPVIGSSWAYSTTALLMCFAMAVVAHVKGRSLRR